MGVGLWDTVAAARRPGSLDADIRLEAASDLAGLAAGLPQLQAIAFNGGTSARIGRRHLGEEPAFRLIDLPSSSPAYTLAFSARRRPGQALRPYLRRWSLHVRGEAQGRRAATRLWALRAPQRRPARSVL
jgi:G:T/U-mismatch repair DNA glycosylase